MVEERKKAIMGGGSFKTHILLDESYLQGTHTSGKKKSVITKAFPRHANRRATHGMNSK